MASAYVNSLNSSLPARQPAPERLSLKDRFMGWYDSLPAFTRSRPFSMSEFEAALATQGKYLSPVLMSLGWTRRRIYAGAGPYHRYWVPPAG
jgi:hypothetical protein